LNLFISLVEEAYVVVEIKNKKSWIYKYIKIEPKLVNLKLHSKKSLLMTKDYFKNFKKNTKKKSRSFKSHDLFVKKDSFADETRIKPIKSIKSFTNLKESLSEKPRVIALDKNKYIEIWRKVLIRFKIDTN
jgi:hypothetical protein